jgi:hypothetical protein
MQVEFRRPGGHSVDRFLDDRVDRDWQAGVIVPRARAVEAGLDDHGSSTCAGRSAGLTAVGAVSSALDVMISAVT